MPSYVIAYVRARNQDWQQEYNTKQAVLVTKHRGRFLVQSRQREVLEGTPAATGSVIVIEFPNSLAANAWYMDPEQLPLVRLRQGGADADLILVPGVET